MQDSGRTTLLIFGATGDLMGKKIVPSLWHLFEKGRLPKEFEVIGLSRRSLSEENFRALVKELMQKYVGEVAPDSAARFLALFSFQRVTFDQSDDFESLAHELDSRDRSRGPGIRLLYMAVPPEAFPQIFGHSAFGEIVTKETRAIIEKPFGIDLSSARELEEVLARRFTEEQLYRADHYLAKPVLRTIPSFRFDDGSLENIWNAEHIGSITIRTWEPLGLENRGAFYDPLGTLRDVGQNHLLEMLALITMEKPDNSGNVEEVRAKRAEVLGALRIPNEDAIRKHTFRAQYEGYRAIEGVKPDSETETYYRLTAYLDNERWRGVPIIMEAGKRLPRWKTEIRVNFKEPKYSAAFIMRPEEKILFSKSGEEKKFPLADAEDTKQYVAEYARIIMDAAKGDQTLFVSEDEIENAWRFIDPIENAWKKNVIPLAFYSPDTDEAVALAEKKWSDERLPS